MDFESAIRLAVSLGGDSDTLTCITGGIADAFYSNRETDKIGLKLKVIDFKTEALNMQPNELKSVVVGFCNNYLNIK